MSWRNGCSMASFNVSLKNGLNYSSFSSKSIASGGAAGYFKAKFYRGLIGKVYKYSIALLSVIKHMSSADCEPKTSRMTPI